MIARANYWEFTQVYQNLINCFIVSQLATITYIHGNMSSGCGRFCSQRTVPMRQMALLCQACAHTSENG
jgi:hypothetical protein